MILLKTMWNACCGAFISLPNCIAGRGRLTLGLRGLPTLVNLGIFLYKEVYIPYIRSILTLGHPKLWMLFWATG